MDFDIYLLELWCWVSQSKVDVSLYLPNIFVETYFLPNVDTYELLAFFVCCIQRRSLLFLLNIFFRIHFLRVLLLILGSQIWIICTCQDSFTRCFKSNSPEPWNWNIYLFPLWVVGVIMRYGILFPIRFVILVVIELAHWNCWSRSFMNAIKACYFFQRLDLLIWWRLWCESYEEMMSGQSFWFYRAFILYAMESTISSLHYRSWFQQPLGCRCNVWRPFKVEYTLLLIMLETCMSQACVAHNRMGHLPWTLHSDSFLYQETWKVAAEAGGELYRLITWTTFFVGNAEVRHEKVLQMFS